MATVPYMIVRDKLPTFTIINCVQDNWFWERIGHTAILYKDTITGQLQVFESTTLNKFTGQSGVQMTPFGTWLAYYPGKVYARVPRFSDSSPTANYKRQGMAADFIRKYLGTSYPDLSTRTGRFKLYLSALDFKLFGVDWLTYKGKDNGIFCTMLVVMMLKACGLMDDYQESYEYEPDDTRGGNISFDTSLEFMIYDAEIQLK